MDLFYLFIVLAIVVLFVIVLYNRIVALKQTRENSFADIDVQLKLRHDLVPNLVETVKGYAKHESAVFEKVTEARAQANRAGTTSEKIEAEQNLSRAMFNLYAVAENYPELKANENFVKLQAELSDVENKIAAARRFFNNATAEYNTVIKQFPGILVASAFGYREEPDFDLGEQRKELEQPAKVQF